MKIRELLEKNGLDFAPVELQIRKWQSKVHQKLKDGKWVTRHYLIQVEHWTKIYT